SPGGFTRRGSARCALASRQRQPLAGGNEPGTGSVVAAGRSCLVCVRVTCTLAENDVAGAPLQGSGEVASRTGPGTAPCGPVSSLCRERHVTGNRQVVQRGEGLRLHLPRRWPGRLRALLRDRR